MSPEFLSHAPSKRGHWLLKNLGIAALTALISLVPGVRKETQAQGLGLAPPEREAETLRVEQETVREHLVYILSFNVYRLNEENGASGKFAALERLLIDSGAVLAGFQEVSSRRALEAFTQRYETNQGERLSFSISDVRSAAGRMPGPKVALVHTDQVETREIPGYTNAPERFPDSLRVPVVLYCLIGALDFVFIVVHWKSGGSREDQRIRTLEAENLREVMGSLRRDIDPDIIVLGDFNTLSEEEKFILRRLFDGLAEVLLPSRPTLVSERGTVDFVIATCFMAAISRAIATASGREPVEVCSPAGAERISDHHPIRFSLLHGGVVFVEEGEERLALEIRPDGDWREREENETEDRR